MPPKPAERQTGWRRYLPGLASVLHELRDSSVADSRAASTVWAVVASQSHATPRSPGFRPCTVCAPRPELSSGMRSSSPAMS
jgi:hypothetical protein